MGEEKRDLETLLSRIQSYPKGKYVLEGGKYQFWKGAG